MTWTVILYDGTRYSTKLFHGSPDVHVAKKEACEKFGTFWAPSKKVIALIPGDHPVYS
jgi:hypothetical protein